MATPLITIIVPTYNDWTRLSLCVKALSMQSYPKAFYNVIIVNNNPDDKAPADISLPENFKLIVEKKPGSYAARNAALKLAQGEIIGFTDSDCIPDKDWIKNAVDHLEKNKTCSRIAGRIELYFKDRNPNHIEILETLYAFRQDYYVKKYKMGATANMFTNKYVFDKIGNFNENLMSGGDMEWGQRAERAGCMIQYAKDVVVKHPARNSFEDLKRKAIRVAGGHYQIDPSEKKEYARYMWRLIKSLKPNKNDYKYIFKQKDISLKSKVFVFGIRYRLQFIKNLEKFKMNMGKVPERF